MSLMIKIIVFKGDETYSLVSDSWSTDVGASDNEGFSETTMANNTIQQQIPISYVLRQQQPVSLSVSTNSGNFIQLNNSVVQSQLPTSSINNEVIFYFVEI